MQKCPFWQKGYNRQMPSANKNQYVTLFSNTHNEYSIYLSYVVMKLAVTYSRAPNYMNPILVSVEVYVSRGLPLFNLVGLPQTAVRESKERVRAAIKNSGFDFPPKRIVVNLAPADLPKTDCRFDLAIAIGILIATSQISCNNLEDYELIGELALSGCLRSVLNLLPTTIATMQANRHLILPTDNAPEACLSGYPHIYAASHLSEVIKHLTQQKALHSTVAQPHAKSNIAQQNNFATVKKQSFAKRALEIAAAGGHHLLLLGPPGTGKSMMAHCFPSILPELTPEQALEVATIQSLNSTKPLQALPKHPPFVTPHHSISYAGLIGGGSTAKPGAITRAHLGILFLDELAEFKQTVIDMLREPMETQKIQLDRSKYTIIFPAMFQLIAASNPCPCGYLGHLQQTCRCSPAQIQRYLGRISGPIWDRFDLQIQTALKLNTHETQEKMQLVEDSSETISKRVKAARKLQLSRANKLNTQITNEEIHRYCKLETGIKHLFNKITTKTLMSFRAQHACLKVARTIADLANSKEITQAHLLEATAMKFDLNEYMRNF